MFYIKQVLFFLLLHGICPAQQGLQITYIRSGKLKKYELFAGENLEYKLKGEYRYRKNKLSAVGDSMLFFANDSSVRFIQLKKIRLRTNNHLILAFQSVFMTAGVIFITVDTANNLILDRSYIISEKAVLISAGLIAASFFIRRLGIVKLRINKNKTLRPLYVSYNNLGPG